MEGRLQGAEEKARKQNQSREHPPSEGLAVEREQDRDGRMARGRQDVAGVMHAGMFG